MSEGPLDRQLISILASNREDSYATQRKRAYILSAAARLLRERFGLQKFDNLKAKHVAHLVDAWKRQDAGKRSVEEKLTHLRWLVRMIGKANLVPRSNAELGIKPGPRHTRAGRIVSNEQLSAVLDRLRDSRIRTLLLLGRYLGLRFKEACLFRPWQDWQGDRVWVKRGTKGGRPRYLWLHDSRQAEVLEEGRRLTAHDGGLIPTEFKTYEKWRQYMYRILREGGIGRHEDLLFHDLRRTYLVERMKTLVEVRRIRVEAAARIVSREAGHSRVEILDWYLMNGRSDGGGQPNSAGMGKSCRQCSVGALQGR